MAPVQKTGIAVEIISLSREPGQLGNDIFRECSPAVLIGKSHLSRFKININQISLLFRESEVGLFGIYVIVLNKGGILHLVTEKADQIQLDSGHYRDDHQCYECTGERPPDKYSARLRGAAGVHDHQENADHDQKSRKNAAGDILFDHSSPGAFQRGLQMKNDLIHLQPGPGCKCPDHSKKQDSRDRGEENCEPGRNFCLKPGSFPGAFPVLLSASAPLFSAGAFLPG